MAALKNKKHERFCREYVIDHNGTQAAIRAKYSKKTANEQAGRLLVNVSICERIKELDDKKTDELEITQERILKEYAKLAFTNSDDLMLYTDEYIMSEPETTDEETGELIPAQFKKVSKAYLKPHDDLTEIQKGVIQEIRETQTGVAIKLYDKKSALDSLAKIKGMFVDKHEVSGTDGQPIQTITRVIVDPKGE